jgi:hypothetical protein
MYIMGISFSLVPKFWLWLGLWLWLWLELGLELRLWLGLELGLGLELRLELRLELGLELGLELELELELELRLELRLGLGQDSAFPRTRLMGVSTFEAAFFQGFSFFLRFLLLLLGVDFCRFTPFVEFGSGS